MQIQFWGATGTVTGSKTLVQSGKTNVLVDCGLFQGYKQLRLRNWQTLPLPPARLDAVLLTHAHLDHSGYLPLLVRDGFRGKIYCTRSTYELCKILLPDSGHLQEEDAAYANRHGFSRHQPALPLYTEKDARHALRFFEPVEFSQEMEPAPGLRASFHVAGHILGAATIRLSDGSRTITFSGDLGRPHDAIMKPPEMLASTDYLVLESTYGNRHHEAESPLKRLGEVIRRTAARGGVVVIPSFAVGRAQELMYYVRQLKLERIIPDVLPVYLDSPMARDATRIFQQHPNEHRLNKQECDATCNVATIVNSPEESQHIDMQHMPMVIISASGMATGGRVLHHLKAFAGDARNTILFAGYQAGGTRGAAMIGGATSVKIHGQQVTVRAEVAHLDNLSAHADVDEIIGWLHGFKKAPRHTFINHGEPDAADALRLRIESELKWNCSVADYLQQVDL